MRALRASRWRWLGAVALGGSLLAGGVWYAAHHNLMSGALAAAPMGAFAQEATPPPSPTPILAASAQTNSPRPTGQVVQITQNPATFTIQTTAGTQMTYRVLDSTVFMAGRDRPYHFDLLKQGDTVIVLGGRPQGAQPIASPGPAGAASVRGGPARPGRIANAADGTLVARQVMVRPAGEKVNRQPGQAASRPNGGQNGGRNGAGQ